MVPFSCRALLLQRCMRINVCLVFLVFVDVVVDFDMKSLTVSCLGENVDLSVIIGAGTGVTSALSVLREVFRRKR